MTTHSHLQDRFPDDRDEAAQHMRDHHGYGVGVAVPWGRIAMAHADLHRRSEQYVPADDRIDPGTAPDPSRPASGDDPA